MSTEPTSRRYKVHLSSCVVSGEAGCVVDGADLNGAPRKLADLARAQPTDATTRNLLDVINAKLELSARLPVLEWEADREGWTECAAAFRRLAESERLACSEILDSLRLHLQAVAAVDGGARP